MNSLSFFQRFFVALMVTFLIIGVGAILVYTVQRSLIGAVVEVALIISVFAALEGGENGRGK